jgi:hypothetical protein
MVGTWGVPLIFRWDVHGVYQGPTARWTNADITLECAAGRASKKMPKDYDAGLA